MELSNAKIRQAKLEEWENIVAFFDINLHDMYHDGGFLTIGMIRDKIQRGNVFVAESEAGILGIAVTNGVTLWNLVVDRKYRDVGIGSFMLASIRPKYVRIKCKGGFPDPTDFYKKNGYRPIEFVPSEITKKNTILLAERIDR